MRIKNHHRLFIAVFTAFVLVSMLYISVNDIRKQQDKVTTLSINNNRPLNIIKTYAIRGFGLQDTQSDKISRVSVYTILIMAILLIALYRRRAKNIKKQLHNCNLELNSIYNVLKVANFETKIKVDEIEAVRKDLKASTEKYQFLSYHDDLTSLPNRKALFEDATKLFLDNSIDNVSLIYIDIDNFKYLNDTMGHDFGDELIKQASQRLQANMNNSDLYRLSGDEFVILGVMNISEAQSLVKKVLSSFNLEFLINNINVHIGLSMGIALYPEHGKDINSLIKAADIAMYMSKGNGKNRYSLYKKDMDLAFSERMILEKYLHLAMEKDEFELYYQPQINLENNRITGLEALIRWKSPQLGNVSPMDFIKVAEDTRLIIPLGEWVLVQACEFLSQLHNSGYPEMIMSVNISTIQILQNNFVSKVQNILKYFKLDPKYLELEITETILIESFDIVYKRLQILSDLGIHIALDDFGKGYSSLNYLKQLPINTLKIDKCFIDNVSVETENIDITRHIISMGKDMGLSIVAEGVEEQAQLDYLKKYHCDKMQGYLFSKPLPKSEIEKLVQSSNIDLESVLM